MADQTIITFADDLGTEMIDICVGKEGQRYTVHKDQLYSGSKYFAFLPLRPGLSGKNATIDMKAEDIGAMSLLISFLYRRSVPTFEGHQRDMKARENTKSGFQGVNAASTFPKPTGLSIFQTPQLALTPVKAESGAISPFGQLTPQLGSPATPSNGPSNPITFGTSQSIFGRSGIVHLITPTVAPEPKSTRVGHGTELYQITLIRLCILAEKTSWPVLYNAAIRAYTKGENILLRSTPIEHFQLIYWQSRAESKLRQMALDGVFLQDKNPDMGPYISFSKQNDEVLRALWQRSLSPKEEYKSVFAAAEEGVYDLLEDSTVSGFHLFRGGSEAPSNFNSSSDSLGQKDVTEK